MRIAYLSPLPPDPSGVADYSAELLPWLRRECEVDAYTAAAHAAAVDAGALGVTVRPYEAFAALADRYDALLAHFSCEQAAVGPYEVFERFGGIAVLHDLNLSGLFGARVFSSRPGYYFFPELWRQEGAGAALKAATRFLLTRQFPGTHDYWMSRGVIRRSRAVIVHSHWSRDWVAAAQGGRSQAFAVTMGVPLPERPTPAAQAAARAALGLSPTAFVIGSFGVVDESKRFTPILRAFAAVASRLPEARYVFVGRCQDQHLRQVADMGLTDRVHMVGRVDEHRFYEYMTAADVAVNLRFPVHGESSAPLLRLMSVGKPVAITDVAQFREFPREACRGISIEHEEAELAAWIEEMYRDRDARLRLGDGARAHVERRHTLQASAASYAQALREILAA